MSFVQHCTDGSAAMLALSTHLDVMEHDMLELEETRNSSALIAKIVTDLFATKDLSDELLYKHIPAVAAEEPSVALAMRIGLQELMKRYWGVRDDLEILTKTKKPQRDAHPEGQLLQFSRQGRTHVRPKRVVSGNNAG